MKNSTSSHKKVLLGEGKTKQDAKDLVLLVSESCKLDSNGRGAHENRHDSKSGNCLYVERDYWYCHHCHTGGDAIDWITNLNGIDDRADFGQVLEITAEIAGVGLRNMIKILVWDEAGNVTERQMLPMRSSGGDSARGGGVILSGEIGDNATINIDTGRDSPPKKRKNVSLWDYVLGAVSSILTGIIAAILMSLYFEEPIENFRIPAGVICVILLIIIYARYRISNSKT